MQQRDLVDEFVASMAEFRRQRLGLALRRGELSAANGSLRWRDLISSRVSAALRHTGFPAATRTGSVSAASAVAHANTAHHAAARQTMASAAMTMKASAVETLEGTMFRVAG